MHKTIHSDVCKREWGQSLSATRVLAVQKVMEYFASIRSSNDNVRDDRTVLSEENRTK